MKKSLLKKMFSLMIAAIITTAVCACAAGSSEAQSTENAQETAAGDVTPYDQPLEAAVIEIGTADELLAFAKSVTDGSMGGYAGQTVVLTADIDCAGIEWTPAGTMDLEDMSNYSCMFQGVFDGQGHRISNVTFESDYPICGVGIIGMNLGEVKNLTAENIQIHCTDTYSMAVGAVVGYNMGVIHDVTLTGENEVAGVNAAGGITGGSTNHVYNCTVDGTTIRVLGDNDFSDGRIIQCDVAECGGLIIGGSFGGTMENCTAKGTIIAEGNEPVGLGGIAGCLEMMDSVTDCTADVEIISEKGGHAIGGLCGYSGTHSVGDIALMTEGVETHEYPGIIRNCHVTVKMNVPGATHVGGLIGTGLYYYGEETAFRIVDCSVNGEIVGAVTPGSVAGRAENSVIESCEASVTLDGEELTDQTGTTDRMYESGDQEEEEETEADEAA
ncbi:MAG: GLUG motif-containing protein [Eubacteriales bacterium]|nr:GLUG motif-containing protein [Eubacteriales bacterium]